ncbi:MAG: SOS response-associated peptidase [Candidatus Saccharibacteria bacterium]
MCGRYTLYQADNLSDRFNLATKPLVAVQDNYNVAPGQNMPIIIKNQVGNGVELMKWGLIPSWAKDTKIGYKLINARSESVFDKPMWRSAVEHYRCLVPARGFYEWKVQEGGKSKQPFYIHPKDQDLFAFAGLWSTYKDVEGYELKSFSILTTSPNKEMAEVHNRMPVILKPGEETHWLESSLRSKEAINTFLHPYEDNKLDLYMVSPDVNSPTSNDKHLIYQL